jgi:hypothetical protein
MRNLTFLLGFTAVVACAPEEQDPLTASVPEGYIVSGTLPEDADLEAIVAELPAGGFSIVGTPGSPEVAVVMAEPDPLSRVASSEFSLVSATCLDCTDPTCASNQRTIEFILRHNTGSSSEQFSIQQVSARNFSSPSANPSQWTAPVASNTDIDVTGTLGTCTSFNFNFDVIGASRVFATSTTHNGNLGGLAGADAICQARANAASLGGTWKAWLSDATTSAASRHTQSTAPYQLVGGGVVANNWTDLTNGGIGGPIQRDENGTVLAAGEVWTGTTTSGGSDPATCNNWTSSAAAQFGEYGRNNTSGAGWTAATGTRACNGAKRLYCFEQ